MSGRGSQSSSRNRGTRRRVSSHDSDQEPEHSSGRRSDYYRSDQEPEHSSGRRSDYYRSDQEPEHSSGRRSDSRYGQQPGPSSGRRSDPRRDQQPGPSSGRRSDSRYGQQPGTWSGQRSDSRYGQQPGPSSGRRFDPRRDQQPGPSSGRRFDPRRDQQPGPSSGQRLDPRRDQQPGSSSEECVDLRWNQQPGPSSGRRFDPRSGQQRGTWSGRRFDPRSGQQPGTWSGQRYGGEWDKDSTRKRQSSGQFGNYNWKKQGKYASGTEPEESKKPEPNLQYWASLFYLEVDPTQAISVYLHDVEIYRNGHKHKEKDQPSTSQAAQDKPGTSEQSKSKKDKSKKGSKKDDRMNKKKAEFLTRNVELGRRVQYRRLCEAIIRSVCENNGFIEGVHNMPYVYDGKKMLYLLKPIEKEVVFDVDPHTIGDGLSIFIPTGATVKIKKTEISFELSNFEESVEAGNIVNHSLCSFFELLTTQSLYTVRPDLEPKYDIVSSGTVFERYASKEGVHLQTELRRGFKKGVRFIRGPENQLGRGMPALVVDTLSSVFYPPMTMYDVIQREIRKEINRIKKESNNEITSMTQDEHDTLMNNIRHFYKGVRGYLTHAPRRTMVFEGFTDFPMSELTVTKDDGSAEPKDFLEYHFDKFNVTVLDPEMPAVKCDFRNNEFPPQVFHILPYQRVPTHKLNKTISALMIESNVVDSHVRLQEIKNAVETMNNDFMSEFGVRLNKEMITDPDFVGPLEQLQYRLRQATLGGSIKGADLSYKISFFHHYAQPAVIPRRFMAVYEGFEGNRQDVIEKLEKFVQLGRRHGMEILDNPSVECMPRRNKERLKALFERQFPVSCRNSNFGFVLFISDNNTDDIHHYLKYLEQRHGALTQQVTVLSFQREDRWQRVYQKMNVKCGGLNYIPQFRNPSPTLNYADDIFVFAYDVAHPAPATGSEKGRIFSLHNNDKIAAGRIISMEPSVVGYAANMAENPFNFIGNYAFQQSRQEAVDSTCLTRCLQYCLKKLRQNRATFTPTRVIVIRDGVSEGDYSKMAIKELEVIKSVIKSFFREPEILFNMVVVNKRHSKRFFSSRRDARIVPPRVVRSVVVRPNFREIYLMSHSAPKGTVKLAQYADITEPHGLSDEDFENFFHLMCNAHQVFSGGVSIPAPVFLAHELAKRGRHNYIQYKQDPDMARHREVQVNIDSGSPNFELLTNELSYNNRRINMYRFTA